MTSYYFEFGLDEDILARQRHLAETLMILWGKGWTPESYYAELRRRGVNFSDYTRIVVEISWQLWQHQQEAAIPVEMPAVTVLPVE